MPETKTRRAKYYIQSFLEVVDGRSLVGLWFDEIKRMDSRVLTREEEQKLGRQIEQGDEEAYVEFVRRNFRLVIDIAKTYIIPGRQECLEYADLIQEGNIGLLNAIRKWDYSYGLKFSTYATYWIHQRITRALANSGIIRIPVHIRENIRKVSRAITDILGETGETPTIGELVERTGLDHGETAFALDVLGAKTNLFSLESELSGTSDDALHLIDLIADHYSEGKFEEIERQTPALRQMMAAILRPRELLVIELRFGFRGRALTLEEVGREFNVTRERIRQIQSKALKKLFRHKFFRAVFRERFGNEPPEEYSPLWTIDPAGRRGRQFFSDNGRSPLEESRQQLLTKWGENLVEIPENEIEVIADL
ncbi:MAG TPA: sigma-70 family RNA polymerase sigma factor [Candidatus Nanoarchaeia archaeon]